VVRQKIFKAAVKDDTNQLRYVGSIHFLITGNKNQPVVNGSFAAHGFNPELEMQSLILVIPHFHTGKVQLNRVDQDGEISVHKVFFDHQDWFANPTWLSKI